jgi:hypothetical protein
MSGKNGVVVVGCSWEAVRIVDILKTRVPNDWVVEFFAPTSLTDILESVLANRHDIISFVIVGSRNPTAWAIANVLKHLQVVGSVKNIVVVSYHDCFERMRYVHEVSGEREIPGIHVSSGDYDVIGSILSALGLEQVA